MATYEPLRAVTRRSTLFVLTAFAGVLGTVYQSPILMAFFESLLVLALLCWLYVRFAARRIAAGRTVAPRACEEDEVPVTLRLWNRSIVPIFMVEVRDWFAADGLPEKRTLIPRLPPAEAPVQFDYGGVCSQGRGRFHVGPLEVEVGDPLGLFSAVQTFPVLSELVVYPKTFPIRDPGFQELHWRAPMAMAAERAGQAATFFGTREYRPGDNIRRLHWPSFARWGRLILKEFEHDASLEVTCFLDLDQSTLRGVGSGSNVDQAVRIAASMGAHVTSRLGAFQLVADAGAPVLLPSRHGRGQQLAVLDTLAQVRATGRTPYLDLVSSGLPLVSEGSSVVLIFNTFDVDDDALMDALSGLAQKRARIVPILLDDTTFIALESAKPRKAGADDRLATLEEGLARFGARPVVVRSGDDLARVFSGERMR